MKKRQLGTSSLSITPLTLGTMTYGVQTSESDACAQMDLALKYGINAIDTAELYPVLPISKSTQGESERIIGRYMSKRKNRDDIVLLSKIVGIGNTTAKNGEAINKAELIKSLDRSLLNLKTDMIDLYQLHWPNRGSYHFRKYWGYEISAPSTLTIEDNLLETLETLNEFIQKGKIKAFGLSNDTAWGVMKFQELSRQNDLPYMASIQNEYSLLHRIYEPDLSEIGVRENIGLLTYSSLAAGILTGKYNHGSSTPPGSRRSIEPMLSGRLSHPAIWEITENYLAIARKYGISSLELAYRFCLSKEFVASVIIGARNIDQCKQILSCNFDPLPDEILVEIDKIRRIYPIPL